MCLSASRRIARALLTLALAAASGAAHAADDEVNIYTTREPGLVQPLLDDFTAKTGIKTNAVFVESGIAERLEAEAENSPATPDGVLTVIVGGPAS